MNSKYYLGKSFVHLMFLETLVDLFPDARLIYTYRPLSEVVASKLSFYKYLEDPMGFDTNTDQWYNRYVVYMFDQKMGI